MRFLMNCFAASIVLGCGSTGMAAVKMSALFSDNMVLQRDAADRIWGSGDPGEKVTVTLNGKSESATADDKGQWKLQLPAQAAGGPFELKVAGSNTLTFKNVMLGDVWVCAGQSNMEMGVNRCADPKEEIAKADHPNVRLFLVDRTLLGGVPKKDCTGAPGTAGVGAGGGWAVCGPKSVPMFSGMGYAFACDLQEQLKVPIGMIHACRGSTSINSWISRKAQLTASEAAPGLKKYDDIEARLPELLEKFKKDREAWNAAKAAGTPVDKLGPFPEEPGPEKDMYTPACVFNGQIFPLTSLTIKGVIWSHGEGDIGRNAYYAQLFPLLIKDWREHWGQGDFPFLFVQLSNFGEPKRQPAVAHWAEIREIQAQTLSLPNTAMACSIDLGNKGYFIPDKKPFAARLALGARAVAYGEKIEYSGPVFEKLKVQDAKAVVSFSHLGGGLKIKGEKLTGFAIAGEDGKFVWADAVIEGETVVVSSPQVPHPVSVRYAWADNPECNLVNQVDLPAVPFRTDHLPN